MNRRWLYGIFLPRLVAGQVPLQEDSSYVLILFMRALKMSTESDIRVAGQSKFHPMAPLILDGGSTAGPGRKATLSIHVHFLKTSADFQKTYGGPGRNGGLFTWGIVSISYRDKFQLGHLDRVESCCGMGFIIHPRLVM